MLAATAATLALLAPVVVHDADERHPLAGAGAYAPTARDAGDRRPAVYARAVPARSGGRWLQYWLYFPYQDQDRGLVRTGRHEGDWELVQYRVRDDRILEAVYAQHSGAERCAASEVERRGGRPVVYAAHGSHASYLHAGTRDRLWPDPNDEADGRGRAVSAPVVQITATEPHWMTSAVPWGDSRASRLVPLEQDSPAGPYFQPTRWDADAFADGARDCQADCDAVGECDTPEKGLTAAAVLAALALTLRRVRRRRKPPGGATG